jgi:hypothetical protein
MGEMRNAYILAGRTKEKRPLGRFRHRWRKTLNLISKGLAM